MNEPNLTNLMLRSAILGIRAAFNACGIKDENEKFSACLRLLKEIADNETTLIQPQYILDDFDPITRPFVIGISNQSINADRELASRIFANPESNFPIGNTSTEGVGLFADLPPLRVDQGSVIRVGRSRVSLDVLIEQYENGMTPEDIVRAYDTLQLADVHAAISYYLRHRDEVNSYLKRRAADAEALRAKIELERPRLSAEELVTRRKTMETADVAVGQ